MGSRGFSWFKGFLVRVVQGVKGFGSGGCGLQAVRGFQGVRGSGVLKVPMVLQGFFFFEGTAEKPAEPIL
jgi:hypothetical protein